MVRRPMMIEATAGDEEGQRLCIGHPQFVVVQQDEHTEGRPVQHQDHHVHQQREQFRGVHDQLQDGDDQRGGGEGAADVGGVRRVWNTAATINVMPMPSRKPNARSSISEVNGESPVSTKFVSCRITSGIAKNIVTAISAAATPFATFIHRRARRTDASPISSTETRLADVRRHRSTMLWERERLPQSARRRGSRRGSASAGSRWTAD